MNKPALLLLATLAGCAMFQPTSATAAAGPSREGPLLGTFDSRLLALAYYRSSAFKERLDTVRAEHARALAVGDAETAHRIEKEMSDLQSHIHLQGFGTAPVPEILALIESEIPAIAKNAGVQAVASRWDLVWQEPGASFPDLSYELAASFHPDAETLKVMKEAARMAPVPLP